jgi:glutamate synthase (NADPH) small chain
MGKPTGFMEYPRVDRGYGDVAQRLQHYQEFVLNLDPEELTRQGARCMDCGIPFCHRGCPLNNLIPDWNDLVYRGDWEKAITALHATNNFPEFTGRICPAPCEESCTLNIEDTPVTIKTIENAIIDRAWEEGWIKPWTDIPQTGKSVAVVGSGPAGLACAQQLTRAGHKVTVYEKEPVAGGLLRLGIPDFKLDKKIVERRIEQMRAEGVEFVFNTCIGVDKDAHALAHDFDAVVLAGGSEQPRDLPIPGRELNGVYFAMEFLKANSKWVQGIHGEDELISAKDKHVVVIGGGDTGSDCIGTSNRHGATSITQLEINPKPPEQEDKATVWPDWPWILRTSSSHDEGCARMWSVATKEFIGDEHGNLKQVRCVKLDWSKDDSGRPVMNEIPGSEFTLDADIVTLAMGFVHPVHEGMIKQLELDLDARGNVQGDYEGNRAFQTSAKQVFSCGDMRRGQSLVVWAINEGRRCARAVDVFLMGESCLP